MPSFFPRINPWFSSLPELHPPIYADSIHYGFEFHNPYPCTSSPDCSSLAQTPINPTVHWRFSLTGPTDTSHLTQLKLILPAFSQKSETLPNNPSY